MPPAGASLTGGVRHDAGGEPLSLELMTTAGSRTRELVEQVLQSQWKRLGIDIRIRNEPARVFFGETVSRRKLRRHGDVRLDQRARERAADHAPFRADPDRGQRLGRAERTPASRTRKWTS